MVLGGIVKDFPLLFDVLKRIIIVLLLICGVILLISGEIKHPEKLIKKLDEIRVKVTNMFDSVFENTFYTALFILCLIIFLVAVYKFKVK